MKELPIYNMIVDAESDGVEFMAIVDKPAIGVHFEKFADAVRFKMADESKHILFGPIFIPDMLIYRFTKDLGELYVKADAAAVEQMVLKFSRNGNFSNVNLMHDEDSVVDNVYMFESFIGNKARGIFPTAFADLPDGTWFGSYKVDNDEVWNEYINTGRLKGFSLEGHFKYEKEVKTEPVKLSWEDAFLSDIEKVIREI